MEISGNWSYYQDNGLDLSDSLTFILSKPMSSSIFDLPVSTWSSTQPAGKSSRPPSSKKRKRRRVSTGVEEPGEVDGSDVGLSSSQSSTRPPILTPDEIYQYSVAGQPLDQELPSHHFPHTSGQTALEKRAEEDHESRSRHDPKGRTASTFNLRQQHLAVITAILHRCILKRDWDRASRALGMILRDEIGGHTVDIRTHARWGIGAEILLQRGNPPQSVGKRQTISRSGFELARRYYERLIVQYPHHKLGPAKFSYDERDFHMALLGLRIYVAHQEGKMLREGDPDEMGEDRMEPNHEAGVQRELGEARKIAQRMDNLMLSSLWSHHVEMIRLRGMVALWIADLAREAEDLDSDVSDVGRSSSFREGYDDIETRLSDSISGVDLNRDGGERYDGEQDQLPRRPPKRNLEAERAETRAQQLFDYLRQKTGEDL